MMADEKTEVDGGVPLEDTKPPLSIKVGMENGKVVTIFSERLSVFSLPWDEAEKYADALFHHASEAKEASGT